MTHNDRIWMYVTIGTGVFIVIFLIVCLILDRRSKKRADANNGIDPKRPRQTEFQRKVEERRAVTLAKQEQQALARTVVKTKILDSQSTMTSKGSMVSSAGRAVLGGMVAGTIGAIIGGSTGKRTIQEYKSTTFKVWYGDGSIKIKTVSNGSYDWKQYMEKLEE